MRRIDEETQHIAAISSGGPDTPCPVCRKPYGEDYEEIRSTHEANVAAAKSELPALQDTLAAAEQAREQAEEMSARARDADKALERTRGPATLTACGQQLQSSQHKRTGQHDRLRAIVVELPALQTLVRGAREVAEQWASAHGIVAERERRFTKATRATGTESYDPKAHQRARQRSEYLAGIAQEAEELRDAHRRIPGTG